MLVSGNTVVKLTVSHDHAVEAAVIARDALIAETHHADELAATLDDAHLVLGMVIEAIGADTFNRIVTAAAEKRTTP